MAEEEQIINKIESAPEGLSNIFGPRAFNSGSQAELAGEGESFSGRFDKVGPLTQAALEQEDRKRGQESAHLHNVLASNHTLDENFREFQRRTVEKLETQIAAAKERLAATQERIASTGTEIIATQEQRAATDIKIAEIDTALAEKEYAITPEELNERKLLLQEAEAGREETKELLAKSINDLVENQQDSIRLLKSTEDGEEIIGILKEYGSRNAFLEHHINTGDAISAAWNKEENVLEDDEGRLVYIDNEDKLYYKDAESGATVYYTDPVDILSLKLQSLTVQDNGAILRYANETFEHGTLVGLITRRFSADEDAAIQTDEETASTIEEYNETIRDNNATAAELAMEITGHQNALRKLDESIGERIQEIRETEAYQNQRNQLEKDNIAHEQELDGLYELLASDIAQRDREASILRGSEELRDKIKDTQGDFAKNLHAFSQDGEISQADFDQLTAENTDIGFRNALILHIETDPDVKLKLNEKDGLCRIFDQEACAANDPAHNLSSAPETTPANTLGIGLGST